MSTIKKPRRMARPPYAVGQVFADPRSASGPGTAAPAEKRATKQGIALDLLHRDEGASLADIAAATNWLPHTTRAALTGLRKRGHTIIRDKVDGVTRYVIASGPAE